MKPRLAKTADLHLHAMYKGEHKRQKTLRVDRHVFAHPEQARTDRMVFCIL